MLQLTSGATSWLACTVCVRERGLNDAAAHRQYVEHFFQCSECSQHFGAMAAEESAAAVKSTRDAVLWAWHAHNIVRSPLPCFFCHSP